MSWKNSLILINACICIIVSMAVTWIIIGARNHELSAANKRAENLVDAFAGHSEQNLALLERYLDGFDSSLINSLNGLTDTSGDAPLDVHQMLSLRANLMTGLYGLFVLDRNGRLAWTSSNAAPQRTDYSDRAYFRDVRDSGHTTMQIMPPIIARGTANEGASFIPAARAIRDDNGQFHGVLVAALTPEFFGGFYRELDVGENGVVGMLRLDGVLIGRSPSTVKLDGTPFHDSVMYRHAKSNREGSFREAFRADGIVRIAAFQHLERFPIIVYVAFAEDTILGPAWWQYAGNTALIGFLVIATMGIMSLLLLRSRKATEHTAQRLTAMVSTMIDGVLTIDDKEIIVATNPAAQTLFGRTEEELQGQPANALIKPAETTDLRGRPQALGPLLKNLGNRQMIARRRDGSSMPVEVTVSDWLADQATFTTMVIRDISERARAEEVLRRSQKMDAVGHLSGGIAHDFNNLLGIILGNLDIVMRDKSLPELILKRLTTANNNAKRGAELTRRLLSFAQELPQEVVSTDVNTVIRGMDGLLERLKVDQIAIDYHLSEGLPQVDVDTGDLEDAILNLAFNARDAMLANSEDHAGGSSLTIETIPFEADPDNDGGAGTARPGLGVMILIRDTGCGIPKDIIEKVFVPFFSTKEKGKGTGLGLAQVYGFARRSGGFVRIYSEPDIGTTIKLFLPAGQSNTAPPDASDDVVHISEGTETILIVDDEPDMRELAVLILNEVGYTCLEAGNTEEALRCLESHHKAISLVLTDVVMPGAMNGLDLAEQVSTRWPDIAILVATGFAWTQNSSRAGDLPTISKPYKDLDLIQSARQAMDQHQSRGTSARLARRGA